MARRACSNAYTTPPTITGTPVAQRRFVKTPTSTPTALKKATRPIASKPTTRALPNFSQSILSLTEWGDGPNQTLTIWTTSPKR